MFVNISLPCRQNDIQMIKIQINDVKKYDVSIKKRKEKKRKEKEI